MREWKDDIPYLTKAFLAELERTSGKSNLKIMPEALAQMKRYPWPGNVRELKNVVESMVLMAEGNTLDMDNLPQNIRGGVNAKEIKFPVGVTMEEVERGNYSSLSGIFSHQKRSCPCAQDRASHPSP